MYIFQTLLGCLWRFRCMHTNKQTFFVVVFVVIIIILFGERRRELFDKMKKQQQQQPHQHENEQASEWKWNWEIKWKDSTNHNSKEQQNTESQKRYEEKADRNSLLFLVILYQTVCTDWWVYCIFLFICACVCVCAHLWYDKTNRRSVYKYIMCVCACVLSISSHFMLS